MMSASANNPHLNHPPLPPSRTGLLQRITAPFNLGTRSHGSHSTQSSSASPRNASSNGVYKQLPSQTIAHRADLPIQAVDLNKYGTHAILAGQEILKTVQIQDGKVIEGFNLRSAINHSASVHGPRTDAANQRREYLPARDVRWSHGDKYDSIIATAALNGRIALYDVNRLGDSRVELEWIHHHTGQVHKLDFDPFGGYYLLSGSQDKTVRIWDIRNPKAVLKKQSFNIRHPVRDVRWSPTDAGEFALCTESGIVQRWDLRMPSQALLSINAHEKSCYTIDWHPGGRHLVSGGVDKHVRIWDLKSENRRQKPTFQWRTPQSVMNLRWRPASWNAGSMRTGFGQCTQIATSYNEEDPRVHIWDLRRPLIPFREIDCYNSRPNDMVWSSSDFLWTVGDEGLFTRTAVHSASQVQDELSPCAINFMPDASFLTFTEDLRSYKQPSLDDGAAKFLKFDQERFSGNTEDGLSRGASDDEADEDLSFTSSRRMQSRTTSARSTKSQGNTPPNLDDISLIMPLDRSLFGQGELFNNEQVGTWSSISGIANEVDLVKFLALNYAKPSRQEERKHEPTKILERLEAAFSHNAQVCEYAALYRMAQSWRMLCAVVVPELQNWAAGNRERRLTQERKNKSLTVLRENESKNTLLSPNMPSSVRSRDSRIFDKPQKVVTGLFKGVIASENLISDLGSTSSMTTPLAMPLPDSPIHRQADQRYQSLHETVETLPPLPPSVIAAHSTAKAASTALLTEDGDEAYTSTPSPKKSRTGSSHSQHKPSLLASPTNRSDGRVASRTMPENMTSPLVQSATSRPARTDEDRRALMRDYRAHTRPVFTLEAPMQSLRENSINRHDSAGSFPMFSASTDSSHKLQSLTESLDPFEPSARSRQHSEEWQHVQTMDGFDSTPPSGQSDKPVQNSVMFPDFVNGKESIDSAADDAPGFSFGADGNVAVQATQQAKPSASATIWDARELNNVKGEGSLDTAASSASDSLFHFEQVPQVPKLEIHTTNPIKRLASKAESTFRPDSGKMALEVQSSEIDSKDYIHEDFRPIDFTTYEPQLPFAWSALPLLCHIMAFDMAEGFANAQFSVHLLLHLHPFFFNQAHREPVVSPVPAPISLAERLMRPDLSHRIFEGLFLNHTQHLQKFALYGSVAEIKKLCVEFEYPQVYRSGPSDHTVGANLPQDPYRLQISCQTCNTLMPDDTRSCTVCNKSKIICPVCFGSHTPFDSLHHDHHNALRTPSQLWTFCQACGHAGHFSCMQEWFLQPDSQGQCPTPGCSCDCGPGLLRQQRIKRQISEAANYEIIRGSRSGSNIMKPDPLRAAPSPAVDKTRDTLRYSDLRDRGTPSGDEISKKNTNSRASKSTRTSFSNAGSRGRDSYGNRRVRLITPGEENNRSTEQS